MTYEATWMKYLPYVMAFASLYFLYRAWRCVRDMRPW